MPWLRRLPRWAWFGTGVLAFIAGLICSFVTLACAKSLCQDCPVRVECLAGALERREPWGVWGGELFLQGTVIPRKRPRGRPRKDQSVVTAA